MAESGKEVAVRKRQQIDSSKQMMFIFVAGAAFLVGASAVISYFLVKQIIFHANIIAVKGGTINQIEKNIQAAEDLKGNLRVLETNEALNSVKLSENSPSLQPILDALPAEPNADALGAALQRNFIDPVGGLNISSMSIDGDISVSESDGDDEGVSSGEAFHTFSLDVNGSLEQLQELLRRFERSIRVIQITSLEFQAGDDNQHNLKITAKVPYYQSRSVELEEKVVKP